MQRQIERVAASLSALCNSPNAKPSLWLETELLLLGQSNAKPVSSLGALARAVSALFGHSSLARFGLKAFVRLFCLRSDWLERFFEAENLHRGGGVCFLNMCVLGERLGAAAVARLREMSARTDRVETQLIIVSPAALYESGEPAQFAAFDLGRATYAKIAAAIDGAFPCLIGVSFPDNAPPAKPALTFRRSLVCANAFAPKRDAPNTRATLSTLEKGANDSAKKTMKIPRFSVLNAKKSVLNAPKTLEKANGVLTQKKISLSKSRFPFRFSTINKTENCLYNRSNAYKNSNFEKRSNDFSEKLFCDKKGEFSMRKREAIGKLRLKPSN